MIWNNGDMVIDCYGHSGMVIAKKKIRGKYHYTFLVETPFPPEELGGMLHGGYGSEFIALNEENKLLAKLFIRLHKVNNDILNNLFYRGEN